MTDGGGPGVGVGTTQRDLARTRTVHNQTADTGDHATNSNSTRAGRRQREGTGIRNRGTDRECVGRSVGQSATAGAYCQAS